MSDQGFITPPQESAIINGTFDASIFDILLLGMYSTVFVQTVHVFLIAKGDKKDYRIFLGVTLLYLLNVGVAGINWFVTRSFSQFSGSSMDDLFLYASFGPNWGDIAVDLLSLFLSTISNAIFIWRCYNLFNQSRAVILLPTLLLAAQAALFASTTHFDILDQDNDLQPFVNTSIDLSGAAIWTTFACILVTSVLIMYRLHTIPRTDRIYGGTMKNLLDTVIQSGIVLAMTVLTFATVNSISEDQSVSQFVVLSNAASFMDSVYPVLAGLLPTIMFHHIIRTSNRIKPTSGSTGDPEAQGDEAFILNHAQPALIAGDDNSNSRNNTKGACGIVYLLSCLVSGIIGIFV